MKKINLKQFRNIFANIAIAASICLVLAVTFVGGTVGVFSSNSYDAIYSGNPNNKNVSLMINVYWGTEFIEPMLDIIKENNIRVTFFVGGSWAIKNDDILAKMYQNGNEIGNHGYWHKDHKNLNRDACEQEIYLTHEVVKNILDVNMCLFAPPSGSFKAETLQIAQNMGYKSIMWTKDTIDWKYKDTDFIYNRAIKNPQNGDLILMHPTKNTLEALPDIIKFYIDKGYKLTTVSENIAN